jgi:glycosyltransferase involved in cell wall biosynthesis
MAASSLSWNDEGSVNKTTTRAKVLLGADFYAPHWTGVVKSFVNLIQLLGTELDFTVVTVRYDKSLPAEEMVGYAKVVREPFLLQLSRTCYSWAAVRRFWRELKQTDFVIINSPCSNVLPFALLAKLAGKRLAIFHQGDLILPKGFANRVIESIFYGCTWIAMSMADSVGTYTRDYAHHSVVLRYFLHKFQPLLMPMYLDPCGPEIPKNLEPLSELRRAGRVIFGFGGRFVEEKGIDVLIKAIPAVLEQLPEAHFVFAGQTKMAYESTFEDMQEELDGLREHLTFFGLLNGEELSWFFKLLDFVVIPSRSDCFNIFQAEACLSGKPSICTDIPGARDLVKSTGFGLIARKEDPRDLADKLIAAYRCKEELEKSFQAVKDKFDLNRLREDALLLFCGQRSL